MNRVIKMPTGGKESLPTSVVVGDERAWECGSVAFQSVFRSKIYQNNMFKKLFSTSVHQNDLKILKNY
jgi:hypothetical protein